MANNKLYFIKVAFIDRRMKNKSFSRVTSTNLIENGKVLVIKLENGTEFFYNFDQIRSFMAKEFDPEIEERRKNKKDEED